MTAQHEGPKILSIRFWRAGWGGDGVLISGETINDARIALAKHIGVDPGNVSLDDAGWTSPLPGASDNTPKQKWVADAWDKTSRETTRYYGCTEPGLLTSAQAAKLLTVDPATTKKAAAAGLVARATRPPRPGTINAPWVATEAAWRAWAAGRRSIGRPNLKEGLRVSKYAGCRYTHRTWGRESEIWLIQSNGPTASDHFATPEGRKSPSARIFQDGADNRVVKRMCAMWDADTAAVPDYDALLREIKVENNEPVMLEEVRAGAVVRISHNLGTEAGLVESVENRDGDLFMTYDSGTGKHAMVVGWAQERIETNVSIVELNRDRLGNIGFEKDGRPTRWVPSPDVKGHGVDTVLSLLSRYATQTPNTVTLAIYGWAPNDSNGSPQIGHREAVIGQYRYWRDPGVLHIHTES